MTAGDPYRKRADRYLGRKLFVHNDGYIFTQAQVEAMRDRDLLLADALDALEKASRNGIEGACAGVLNPDGSCAVCDVLAAAARHAQENL